VEIENLKFDMN